MSKFLKVIIGLILLGAVSVTGALLIPQYAGITTVIIDPSEMSTNQKQGTVVYAKDCALEVFSTGDKVLNQEEGSVNVYEVLTVERAEDGSLQAQAYVDGAIENVVLSESSQKVILTVPYIGYAGLALKTTEGMIVLGLGAAFVIVLFVLSELLRDDDDDDDDEDDEYYEDEEEEYDDDEDEDDEDEEEYLSRRERRALKKEQKRKEKAEKKAQKRGELPEEEEEVAEEKPEEKVQEVQKTENVEKTENASEVLGDTFDLQAEILKSFEAQKAANEPAAVQDVFAGMDEVAAAEETAGEFQMAIPVYTAEELIEKARLAGDDPEIIRDEESGITILDYSDIL